MEIEENNEKIELTPPPVLPSEKKVNGTSKEESRANKCIKRAAKEQQALLKKKDEKSFETVKKSLSAVSSPDEKVAILCEKYTELLEENRKLVVTVKSGERKIGQMQREKEQLQADHSKVVLTRSRLESLCRELQRQNKAVKEESLGRIREEEEKRKELSARFNVTLNEITTLMQQNTEKNNKLRDENKDLAERFNKLCEQYEIREKHVDKVCKQNQLETKLTETKLAKVKVEMIEEKELLLREVAAYQVQLQEMKKNEDALRSQITMYSEKYDEFQKALATSNEVFSNFKTEMDKMTKKVSRLEKETSSWKTRWENSQKALLELATDQKQKEEESGILVRQMGQLQKLCRTLQDERTKHIARLRQLGEDVGKPDLSSPAKPDAVPVPETNLESPATQATKEEPSLQKSPSEPNTESDSSVSKEPVVATPDATDSSPSDIQQETTTNVAEVTKLEEETKTADVVQDSITDLHNGVTETSDVVQERVADTKKKPKDAGGRKKKK